MIRLESIEASAAFGVGRAFFFEFFEIFCDFKFLFVKGVFEGTHAIIELIEVVFEFIQIDLFYF